MRIAVGLGKSDVEKRLELRGIDRRQFLKYCTAVAVAMGMGPSFAPKVAEALTGSAGGKRPVVVYLHNAECTGCSEALLRTTQPFFSNSTRFADTAAFSGGYSDHFSHCSAVIPNLAAMSRGSSRP